MSLYDTTWSLQVEKLLPPCLRDADIAAINYDFITGDPENNYIRSILVSAPGHWKEYPLIGIAIFKYLQGTQSQQVLVRAIRLQLEADIFKKPFIDVKNFPELLINNVTVSLQ